MGIEQEKKIRVMIVDDSEFMRHLIKGLLQEEADIEVVGEAGNGYDAVKLCEILKPDVVTMDYNMPRMHGADAAELILDRNPDFPPKIIILSAYSPEAIFETFRSLEKGAIGFVRKPSGELSLDIEKVRVELLQVIRLSVGAKVINRKQTGTAGARLMVSETNLKAEIVVIGASTGGPPIVEQIISGFEENFPAAILIVQHMPVGFTKGFADYLDRNSKIAVCEAAQGMEIISGKCLIAPSGQHMVIEECGQAKIASLQNGEKVSGYRPSIDVLMKSVSVHYPGKCLGVILTGMGHDGQAGMETIAGAGGYTIAQSPETATIDTMPLSVINNGLADEILSPHLIIERIKELV